MLFLLGVAEASNVIVRLLSKQEWISPSIQEQIAVGLQQHGATEPFRIINSVHLLQKDKEIFEELDSSKNLFINDHSLNLLKSGVANNQYAVAVQAHYHYYTNYINFSSCDCWVDLGKQRICDFSELSLADLKANSAGPSKLLAFDIKYHNDRIARKTSILYSNLRTDCFSNFYSVLKEFAEKDEEFSFVLRFIPPKNGENLEPINISGYGVELALKNTEYHAVDDRAVNQESSSSKEANTRVNMQHILWEEIPSIQSLTKEKLRSVAAASIAFAKTTSDPFSALVNLSERFPEVAHLISASEKATKQVSMASSNLLNGVTGGSQIMLLNGIPFDIERLNAFEILQKMRTENVMMQKLKSIGLTVSQSIEFASEPLQSEEVLSWGDTFDTTSDAVIFLNDIEKDSIYQQFPSSFFTLLQPSNPNQFKFIRKNLFTVILVLDFTNMSQMAELMRILAIIRQLAPMRFGIMPFISNEDSDLTKLIALSLSNLSDDRQGILDFIHDIFKSLEESSGLDESKVKRIFSLRSGGKQLDLISMDSIKIIQEMKSFNLRLGMTKEGAIFGNGVFTPLSNDWVQQLAPSYFQMVKHLSIMVMQGELRDNMQFDIYNYFLTKNSVYASRNPLIFPREKIEIVSFPPNVNFKVLKWIDKASEIISVSLIVFSDWSSVTGRQTVLESLDAIAMLTYARVAFIDTSSNGCEDFHRFEQLNMSDHSLLKKFVQDLKECPKLDINNPIYLSRLKKIQLFKSLSLLQSGETGFIVNGRRLGPVGVDFSSKDIMTLLSYEFGKRIKAPSSFLKNALNSDIKDNRSLADKILVGTTAILSDSPVARISMNKFGKKEGSPIYFETGDTSNSFFQFAAAIEPITSIGQKIISILDKFHRIPSVSVQMFAAGEILKEEIEKLPLLRYYQFVFQPVPEFDIAGNIKKSLVSFENLPMSALMTLGVDIPGSWLIRPRKSVYDLDNIKLSIVSEGGDLDAEFTLENILVQGHATDSATHAPPRGLQFVLGTSYNVAMVDTITMANLGYLQLKGGPGVWNLSIRKGRSDDVYELEEISHGAVDNTVIVDSFEDITIHPKVSKRTGMKDQDVLVDPGESGMWDSMKSKLFGQRPKSTDETVINVFSVASGHLYERFLAIMMLSVKKATKNPVKFWLIENFLSPSFLEFLPRLSKAFDFDYELVTYKWPHWLRKQTEKQRIIWGYKILFLDVLFPLSLDKVIFVDADQVVRADLRELVDLDLKGAVYGYTPFCESRTEMDGFRFWKGGYWESHLRGRAYHISALYVIDLVKFRAVAAGDRLRQQYHMLSADPNSLSNLDQDLPNNMIHEIPMFSLPQDWLWCETWCSDQSLKTAKTIDLCNNPLTKEPKLDRAKRILPEWEKLDMEIAAVRDAKPATVDSKNSHASHDEL